MTSSHHIEEEPIFRHNYLKLSKPCLNTYINPDALPLNNHPKIIFSSRFTNLKLQKSQTMKNVTLILAMILFSSCVTSKVTAGELESSTNEEPNWFVRAPRIVLPRIPAGDFPPISFHSPPEVTKCLSGKHEIRTCLHDLARKADIGSECCAAIKKMKEDCKNTVYGSYNKPFWAGYFRLHCTTDVVGSTSPPAPSPAQGF